MLSRRASEAIRRRLQPLTLRFRRHDAYYCRYLFSPRCHAAVHSMLRRRFRLMPRVFAMMIRRHACLISMLLLTPCWFSRYVACLLMPCCYFLPAVMPFIAIFL